MTTRVAGLLLAAGAGRRFGGPKALVSWDGEPLVVRGLRTLAAGGAGPVLAVLGAAAREVRETAGLRPDQVVVADGWAEGVGASLRAGLAALAELAETAPVDAVVITLVDQPLVRAEAVGRLVRAASATSAEAGSDSTGSDSTGTGDCDAAVATYAGRHGHPVALRRAVWHEVAALAVGDVGARRWLNAHPDRVEAVACDGAGSPADIDTPADLARLQT